jgi:hypothetical protein
MKPPNLWPFCACLPWLLLGNVFAGSPKISINQVGEHGGGGCVGETRIYAEAPEASVLKNSSLNPFHTFREGVIWREASGRVISYNSFVITTVGCGADRIVAGVNGKTYSLESARIEQLGLPVTYLDEANADSPRIRITLLSKLHEVEFKETECVQRFSRVQVAVEISGTRKTFVGTAVKGC